MAYERTEHGTDGPAAVGRLPSGRAASIRVVTSGNGYAFRAEVSPLEGVPDDERSCEVELARVMADAEAAERRLSNLFGTPCGGPPEVLLRGAASWLAGRALPLGDFAAEPEAQAPRF